MNPQKTTAAMLMTLLASFALAEDFKTVNGKIYKDAAISHVEADGIVIKSKTGISKVYFAELPKDVQERFHSASATPLGKAVTQRMSGETEEAVTQRGSGETGKPVGRRMSGETAIDRFAQQVQNKLDDRESAAQAKHTPGAAELMVMREFNFHKAFLAGTAIIAAVLFAVVWRRFK